MFVNNNKQMKRKYEFNGETFETKTDVQDYVRTILKEIGYTDSVKTQDPEAYKVLASLCQRHKDKERKKVDQMVDLEICNDRGNFKLNMKFDNGLDDEPISWRNCASENFQTPKDRLFSALRQAIDDQIHEFRMIQPVSFECSLCSTRFNKNKDKVHVDHIKHFKELAVEFMIKEKSLGTIIPSTFTKNEGSSEDVFEEKDSLFTQKWQTYHEEHAYLRMLCQPCNLIREKSKLYKNYDPYA
jgi:hypothetical protein